MIIININVEDGLVNGACGILIKITFKQNSKKLIKIWLDFNNIKIGVEWKNEISNCKETMFNHACWSFDNS